MFSSFSSFSPSAEAHSLVTHHRLNLTVRPEEAHSLLSSFADCTAGVQHPNRQVCCNATCGLCGGHGCSRRPGGPRQCCMPAILRTGRVCESRADVACILHEHASYPARARRRWGIASTKAARRNQRAAPARRNLTAARRSTLPTSSPPPPPGPNGASKFPQGRAMPASRTIRSRTIRGAGNSTAHARAALVLSGYLRRTCESEETMAQLMQQAATQAPSECASAAPCE